MVERIKRTNVAGLLLLVVMALVCWAAVQPAQPIQAQQDYGPDVTSELLYFDHALSSAGTHDLIPGVAGKKFRILSLFVRSNSTTANNIYFGEEGVSDDVYGTNSTNYETLDADGEDGKAGWHADQWHETTTAGTDFEITLSESQKVGVMGRYVEIN